MRTGVSKRKSLPRGSFHVPMAALPGMMNTVAAFQHLALHLDEYAGVVSLFDQQQGGILWNERVSPDGIRILTCLSCFSMQPEPGVEKSVIVKMLLSCQNADPVLKCPNQGIEETKKLLVGRVAAMAVFASTLEIEQQEARDRRSTLYDTISDLRDKIRPFGLDIVRYNYVLLRIALPDAVMEQSARSCWPQSSLESLTEDADLRWDGGK